MVFSEALPLSDTVPSHLSGFTAAGEVLNCSTFDVGFATAVALEADKLFVLHREEVKKLELPAWLPLSDAQSMLLERVQVSERRQGSSPFNQEHVEHCIGPHLHSAFANRASRHIR